MKIFQIPLNAQKAQRRADNFSKKISENDDIIYKNGDVTVLKGDSQRKH